ncbi:hypothetical protein [Ancylobacter polymorphus]|uniref:Uncharacterized protein n=1 Tax=Ancylobacter polymorphus TaxID=223390 RepID=A0ABU0B6E8_9HYPH|nr:hypothetical protein [Ancylobacter polymorphus]MDQ0301395.1 hypothetical protein [Ancylobacter polymorphus]
MSSLIGDPIWPVLHHIAGTVGAAVGHVWSGIVNMDAGDWAGWAQAVGAVIAIIVAFQQGHADTRARLEDRVRAEAEDRNHRVINYEIAADIFKSIAEQASDFIAFVQQGHLRMHRSSDPLFSLNSSLSLLDRLMVERLPSTNAAIDVQTMRLIGYSIRSDMQLMFNEAKHLRDKSLVPQQMVDVVAEAIELANVARGDDGPINMAHFRDQFEYWRRAPIPVLGE